MPTISTKFFTFVQNNPGGFYITDHRVGDGTKMRYMIIITKKLDPTDV